MATNTLTDAKCRSFKPESKPVKKFDGGGLFLLISPAGAKIWRLAYRFAAKPKTMSFGPYPEVSLAQAREKRDAAKKQLRDGIDPMAERQSARLTTPTFKEVSAAYWAGRQDLSTDYVNNAQRALEMHLFPFIGDRPVHDIDRDALMAGLAAMDAAGRFVYVRKTRMWASHVFEFAIARGYRSENPAAGINSKKAFGKRAVKHFAALDLRQLPDFLRAVRLEGQVQSALACWAIAYTAARTDELRFMAWAEIDWEEAVWHVGRERMKMGRPHLVPLSRQMLAVLRTMQARSRGSRYVFPHPSRLDRSMSENAVLSLIDRLGYKGVMTGHGWRTVVSTWGNKHGYNKDAIERALAHAPDDEVRAIYNQWEYFPERREFLQAWADWLESCGRDAESVTADQAAKSSPSRPD